MKIAALILAHIDSEHVARLAHRVSSWADIFIHIDARKDENEFRQKMTDLSNVHFVEKRYCCYWAGFATIEATIELMRTAMKHDNYDRLIFMQGLDYPIKSDKYIVDFFYQNKHVEFMRGFRTSGSKNIEFSSRGDCYWFFDKPNFLKRAINKLNSMYGIKVRRGYAKSGGKPFYLYWAAAQWAITGDCAKYILDFYQNNPRVNAYFKHVGYADETYFCSIVHNSPFSEKTYYHGAEPEPSVEKQDLVYWRNLHYFEFEHLVRILTIADYEMLLNSFYLFARKMTTKDSVPLLDKLDEQSRADGTIS